MINNEGFGSKLTVAATNIALGASCAIACIAADNYGVPPLLASAAGGLVYGIISELSADSNDGKIFPMKNCLIKALTITTLTTVGLNYISPKLEILGMAESHARNFVYSMVFHIASSAEFLSSINYVERS